MNNLPHEYTITVEDALIYTLYVQTAKHWLNVRPTFPLKVYALTSILSPLQSYQLFVKKGSPHRKTIVKGRL